MRMQLNSEQLFFIFLSLRSCWLAQNFILSFVFQMQKESYSQFVLCSTEI